MRLRFGKLTTAINLNNSFLAVAIGTGIPGGLLWFGWPAFLGRFAVWRLSGTDAFEARFLLLAVLVFGLRMGLDNDMQNYTLEQFLLVFGLLMPRAHAANRTIAEDP